MKRKPNATGLHGVYAELQTALFIFGDDFGAATSDESLDHSGDLDMAVSLLSPLFEAMAYVLAEQFSEHLDSAAVDIASLDNVLSVLGEKLSLPEVTAAAEAASRLVAIMQRVRYGYYVADDEEDAAAIDLNVQEDTSALDSGVDLLVSILDDSSSDDASPSEGSVEDVD